MHLLIFVGFHVFLSLPSFKCRRTSVLIICSLLQWLALLTHTNKVVGSNPLRGSLQVLQMQAC